MAKIRIDKLITDRGLVKSRSQVLDLIKRNKISYRKINQDGSKTEILASKAGELVDENSEITISEINPYVSRGGLKLEKALEKFGVNPKDKVCLDIGSSTGGFSHCLLRNGAKHIYAVDVGQNQFDHTLSQSPKITLLEKTDIRDLKTLPEKVNLVVVDVSFISLEKIIPEIARFTGHKDRPRNELSDIDVILLVKPQFEVGKDGLDRNGIVKNEELQMSALNKIKEIAEYYEYKVVSEIDSPIEGGSGNKEFLIHIK